MHIPYRFGRAELRPDERVLLIDGNPVALGARAFDLMLALVERRERVVTKHELLEVVWPGLVVEEQNLYVHINAIRKLVGPHAIATIPGRGYRFAATIEAVAEPTVSQQPTPAPVATAEPLKTSLPRNLTPLVGRDADVHELVAQMLRHPLVTVVGLGGMGKSSLAREVLREVAPRFAWGVCWVELGTLAADSSADETVPTAIAVGLGLRPSRHDSLATLVEAVTPLEVLIALDNAEHVQPAVARVVEAVLQFAPRVRFLVTSQIPLNAKGEQLCRLGPLSWPSERVTAAEAIRHGAVALFVARAQAQDRRFALSDENVDHVVTLCRNLDGLPLAIELAAGRFASLGLRQLCAALDQRLRLLTQSPEGAPARQQTLRASLEWSHSLLHTNEQKVLRRLAVFVGSASLEAIKQVASDEALDEWAVLDALGVLVDRSFVTVIDEDETPRYRLLDTPRALALERLAASGELPAVRARHAAAVRELFERGYADLWSGRVGVEDTFARLEPELDNARAAFAWARVHEPLCAVALCGSLLGACPYPSIPDRLAMWQAIEPLLTSDVPIALRARAAFEASTVASNLQGTATRAYVELAVRQFRELGDRFMLYRALAKLVRLIARQDAAAANAALTEMRTLEDPGWPAIRLQRGAEAETVAAFDDPDKALERSYQLMALEDEAKSGMLHGLACVVEIELWQCHAAAALSAALELVARLEGTRYRRTLNLARAGLLQAWLANDNVGQARALALAGWPDAVVFRGHSAIWSDALALLAALEGRARTCALLCGFAESRYALVQHPRQNSELVTVRRATALARASIADDEFDRLMSEGRLMREGEIGVLGLAEKDYRALQER
jgi:predicted ATPase/DNA-binding winged helix-turn-helix (wHTH) protein